MKCMRFVLVALAAATCLFSAPSFAQRFYVGFSAGQADVDESIAIPSLVDPGANFDGKDTAFKIFGGYQVNQNLALEAALVDLGDVAYSGTFGGAPVTGGRVQNSGLNLSAVGVVPLGANFVLFGKAGVFLWTSEARDVTGGLRFDSVEDGSDLSLGLGLSYAVGPQASVRAEWERFQLVDTDVDLVTVGFAFRF